MLQHNIPIEAGSTGDGLPAAYFQRNEPVHNRGEVLINAQVPGARKKQKWDQFLFDRGVNSLELSRPYRSRQGDIDHHSEWKVATYDGKQDWRSYYIQFQMIASYNGWTEEQQILHLVKALTGNARTVLADMSSQQLDSLSAIVSAIERRYQPKEKTLAHRALFNGRRQNVKEDAASYSEALRLLAVQAFPDMSVENRGSRVRDRFVEGLNDVDLRKAIYLGHHDTLESVISTAVEWEALDEAMRMSGACKPRNLEKVVAVEESLKLNELKDCYEKLSDKADNLTAFLSSLDLTKKAASNSNRPVVICRFCKEAGHTRPKCLKFMQTVICYECHKPGHYSRHCPLIRNQNGRGRHGAGSRAAVQQILQNDNRSRMNYKMH